MTSQTLVWASLLCLLITPSLSAQKTYSLEEIWQKTLEQFPSLSAKKTWLERQEFNKTLVRRQSFPEVGVQAQQSFGSYNSIPGAFFSLPGSFNNSGNNKTVGSAANGSNMYASTVLQWNFMQFGRVQKSLEVAEAAVALSQAAVTQEELRLMSTAARYYFDGLYSSASLNILKSEAGRLASLLDLSITQARAGLHPGADTLLLKSAFLQAKNKITDQQNLLQASLFQIAAMIGEAGNTVWVDTSVYYRLNIDQVYSEASLSSHPYLQYLTAAINHSKAELDAVRKEPYPSVGFLAGMGIKGSAIDPSGTLDKSLAAPWNNNTGSYLLGLGVTWKLSSLYQNKTKRRMAELDIASQKAGYDAEKLQLQALYASALNAYNGQVTKVKEARQALEASQEAYELYTVRYENGLISLIELLQLQKDLQVAENNYVAAVHSYWNKLLDQSEALGKPSLILTAIMPR